jgi:predicted TIM-barrel fold metal-dependent hydrolase
MSDSKTYGQPFGAPGYRIIDSDSHVNEPPDLWTSRVGSKFVDRVPHVQSFEEGDAWVMEGVADPINFGMNACAGMTFEERRPWMRFEDLRRGGWDPKARLAEMDIDLVDAEVLYPTPRISQLVFGTADPDLHLALVQAYNDWLSEYSAHDPTRLGGMFIVPNRGIDQALAEIDRVSGRPGLKGALIGCYPHGDLDLREEDDAVWRRIVDAGMALHIHVSLSDALPANIYDTKVFSQTQARSGLRFLDAPVRVSQFLGAGVFDRVPELQVVIAEVDGGWLPYLKEQVDNRFIRHNSGSEMRTKQLPSAVIEDHFLFTYITDHFAVRNRYAVGLTQLMWSSDYPHAASDWPNSIRTIHAGFSDVPPAERDLILAGNAQRLYNFGA